MQDRKSETKKVLVQIEGGFFTQNVPLMKGAVMAEDKKGKTDEGLVPQNAPMKPPDKEDKGFVPGSSPKKPPEKPDKGKK